MHEEEGEGVHEEEGGGVHEERRMYKGEKCLNGEREGCMRNRWMMWCMKLKRHEGA